MRVHYNDLLVENACRLDFLVGGILVAELKTVDALEDGHAAQLLTYLRFSGCRIGLWMNFRATLSTHGLRRLAL